MHLDIKALVLACNTATSVTANAALSPQMQSSAWNRRSNPRSRCTKGRVAVMATPATLDQPRFLNLLKGSTQRRSALLLPCSDLVELIEEGTRRQIEGLSKKSSRRMWAQPSTPSCSGARISYWWRRRCRGSAKACSRGRRPCTGTRRCGTSRMSSGSAAFSAKKRREGGVEFYSSSDANLRDIFLGSRALRPEPERKRSIFELWGDCMKNVVSFLYSPIFGLLFSSR